MTRITRRAVLSGSTGWIASPFVARLANAETQPWLKEIGAERGIEVGSCYSGSPDPIGRVLLRRHAALITPEWCLKPKFLKPAADEHYRFAEADAIAGFCQEVGAKMHGHTLFWHGDRFDWADSRDLAIATHKYGRFITDVVQRYPAVTSWDVANEIVADQGPQRLRKDALIDAHGAAFVAFLFRKTRETAPAARLCLNDYNLECGKSWCREKAQRLLDLVDQLLQQRVPLDAVGVQSHLSSKHGISLDDTLDLCDRLAARGIDVYLSEVDVNDVAFADDIAARDEAVAEMYGAYLGALLAHPAVKRLVFWGLSDGDHWLVRDQGDDGRPAGTARPALFDKDGRPKRAFHAVVDALRKAPKRPASSRRR